VGGGEERKVGGEGGKRKGKGKREGEKKNWSEDIYSHQSMGQWEISTVSLFPSSRRERKNPRLRMLFCCALLGLLGGLLGLALHARM